MEELKPGLQKEQREKVTSDMSAATVGSGALDVYSTPSMIALMETTAMKCVEPFLESSQSTVGGAVDIRHYKPTAIGATVHCKCELVEVKGKKLLFHVAVYENDQIIGDGQHVRFIVDVTSFMENI